MFTRREMNASFVAAAIPAERRQLKALIVDGRNSHDWRATSPVLRQLLEETKLFSCQFATAPATDDRPGRFVPAFASSDVIVLNYSNFGNGGAWSEQAKSSFVKAVRNGAEVVVYHAASSACADWREYKLIAGLGGWGDSTNDGGHACIGRMAKSSATIVRDRAGITAHDIPLS